MLTKYDIAVIVSMEGLDTGEWQKISAHDQRKLFGMVFAGRKDIFFDQRDQGTIKIAKSVPGKDRAVRYYSYEEFATCLNESIPLEAW